MHGSRVVSKQLGIRLLTEPLVANGLHCDDRSACPNAVLATGDVATLYTSITLHDYAITAVEKHLRICSCVLALSLVICGLQVQLIETCGEFTPKLLQHGRIIVRRNQQQAHQPTGGNSAGGMHTAIASAKPVESRSTSATSPASQGRVLPIACTLCIWQLSARSDSVSKPRCLPLFAGSLHLDMCSWDFVCACVAKEYLLTPVGGTDNQIALL